MALTREDYIRKSMEAPKNIDTTVEFKIPRALKQFDPEKHKFKCLCCGTGVNAQKPHFLKSDSPLFQANDGYLPFCKSCTDKYFSLLTAFYSGNEEHAIGHFCQQVDWVYEEHPVRCAREISSDRSRISHYAAKKNINVGGRKTYTDTLKHEQEVRMHDILTKKEDIEEGKFNVAMASVERWGIGLQETDYKLLDDHYKMLKKNNPNADNNQEIFIKSLCNINMLMTKALQKSDVDKYIKLTEQYSKTFTKAGLKTIQETDNSADECLGVTLATISQFTPEEYYKDKNLYKDFDNLGDYFQRFVLRPMRNLMLNENERDHEFFVKDTENGDSEE